jgi:hypothetical protein
MPGFPLLGDDSFEGFSFKRNIHSVTGLFFQSEAIHKEISLSLFSSTAGFSFSQEATSQGFFFKREKGGR